MTDSFELPAGRLGPVGRSLWDDANLLRDNDSQSKALLLNACRMVDNLDRLNGMLHSNSQPWLEIADTVIDGQTVTVTIDISSAVAEFRSQTTALAGVLGRLGIGGLADKKVDTRSAFMKKLEAMQDAASTG